MPSAKLAGPLNALQKYSWASVGCARGGSVTGLLFTFYDDMRHSVVATFAERQAQLQPLAGPCACRTP